MLPSSTTIDTAEGRFTLQPRTRLGLVLLVAVPLCLYAFLWNVSVVRYYSMVDDPATLEEIVSPLGRLLEHLFMLPAMVACYFLATGIAAVRGGLARVLFKQLALLLAFALVTRPILFVAMQIANGPAEEGPFSWASFVDFMDLDSVVSMSVNYSVIYVLGLSLLFGLMAFAKYREEQLRAAALRSNWLQAQLETLRVQLHPHFLFNTLNTISALVTAKPQEARDLIAELSGFLRDSVGQAEGEFYSLGRECDLAGRYLRIIGARFGARFKPTLAVPEALKTRLVPHGVVLTLLENAVTHGVSELPGDCELTVRCALHEGFLVIEAQNGYDPEIQTQAPSHRGGLAALSTRLEALYGEAFRLEYGGDGRGLWTIRVALPVEVTVAPPAAALVHRPAT